MSAGPEGADSKGSSAPSEARLRNNFVRVLLWMLGALAIAVLLAIAGIRLYSHTTPRHKDPIPAQSTPPSTQPQ